MEVTPPLRDETGLLLDKTLYNLLLDKTRYSTKMIFHPTDRTKPSMKTWIMGTREQLYIAGEFTNSVEDPTWYYDPWWFSYRANSTPMYFRGKREDHIFLRDNYMFTPGRFITLWDQVQVLCKTHLHLTEFLIPVFVALVQWKPHMKDMWRKLREYL